MEISAVPGCVKKYRTDRNGKLSERPTTRRRGRPKTVDRDRAIKVAMDSYWSEGLHAASLNELCRRAGLSKPALYREFGNEDGLMEAALQLYRDLLITPLLDAFASGAPLSQLLERVMQGMTSPQGVPVGCLFTKIRLDYRRVGPNTLARVRTIEAERIAAFEDMFRRASSAGEVNPDFSPAFAARYLDTQLSTILMQMGAGAAVDEVREQARVALRVLLPATS